MCWLRGAQVQGGEEENIAWQRVDLDLIFTAPH